MSQNAHLTPDEEDRILRLRALGMPTSDIACTVNRSRNLVWRVVTGRRQTQVWRDKHNLQPSSVAALETLFAVRLETRTSSVGVSEEADMLTTNVDRTVFIDTLLEHFKGGRRPSERALADLEREIVSDGYSVPVLDRAARDMIRTRYAKGFPSVAECLAACRVAQGQLNAEAVAVSAQQQAGTGLASDALTESRPCPPESEAGPGKTRAESGSSGGGDPHAKAASAHTNARAA